MGCCFSRIEKEETVSRCKSRKRYMKHFVKARQALSASHSMYLRSLRGTGSALLQFATAETALHHHNLPPVISSPPRLPTLYCPNPPRPPPPPMSPTSDTWTTSTTTSSALPPPPPPPPPPQATTTSGWDFWDPFMPSSSRVQEEEEWDTTTMESEAAVTTTVGAANVTAPPSAVSGYSKESSATEMAVVVSTKSKDVVEIIKELDEYFLNAADAGRQLSFLLEVPACTFSDQRSLGKVHSYGKSLSPMLWARNSSSKSSDFGKMSENSIIGCNANSGSGVRNNTHCSTVERLYAWEKKLYLEVKNAEMLKIEHEKRANQLRRLEMTRADYIKTEKMKKEVDKLESRMMVATQAIEATSAEIVKLRESELCPQLVEIVKGLMCMWRTMYECHQVQMHIVQQLKYLNVAPSNSPTSEIHRQSTLQLEVEVQKWYASFCHLIKSQKDYIQSLTGWLRLSLFHFHNKNNETTTLSASAIYALCEDWHRAVDNAPDKVASEGINTFLTVINAIVVQQAEEQKQKKKSDSAFKEMEKRMSELRNMESKFGPFRSDRGQGRDPVGEKRVKVERLRVKAEDERAKYEKAVSVSRAMTLNNLQMGLPHVFQAITGFASVWTHAFETVYNKAKGVEEAGDVKRILP